jgi:cytochrome c556
LIQRLSVVAFAGALALSGAAFAQGATTGLTGVDKAEDVLMARQGLMDAVEEQRMPSDAAIGGKAEPLPALKNRAFLISTLIAAFPHLFPPQTKPSEIENTTATPAVWSEFETFYKAAQDASQVALETGQAKDMETFKARAEKLRAACDSCHAKYMLVPDPPK